MRLDWLYRRVTGLFPTRLIYWCVVRGGAIATSGNYGSTNPHDLDLMELLGRLERKPQATQEKNECWRCHNPLVAGMEGCAGCEDGRKSEVPLTY